MKKVTGCIQNHIFAYYIVGKNGILKEYVLKIRYLLREYAILDVASVFTSESMNYRSQFFYIQKRYSATLCCFGFV